MKMNLVTIGSVALSELKIPQINVFPFYDIEQFFSCRLGVRALSGFLCDSQIDLKNIREIKRCFPTVPILVICENYDLLRSIDLLRAGADDLIYPSTNRQDSLNRIFIRLDIMESFMPMYAR